jgi:predicted TIM-barrel fold metal-dependent hydrolase
MSQIVATIGNTPINGQPGVAYIHFGTIMGDMFLGYHGCCGPEYVDPYYMQPLIEEYNSVTFILVHTGADFLSSVYQ